MTRFVCWRWTRLLRTCRSSRSWMRSGWRLDHGSRITWRAVLRFNCCRSDSPLTFVCVLWYILRQKYFHSVCVRVCLCNRICWGGQRWPYWSTCVWRTHRGQPHGSHISCPHPRQIRQDSLEHHPPGWTSITTSATPSPLSHKSLRFSGVLVFSSRHSSFGGMIMTITVSDIKLHL